MYDDRPLDFAGVTQTLRTIVAALAGGLLLFGAVAVLQKPEPQPGPLGLAMLGLAAVAVVVRLAVPPLIAQRACQSAAQLGESPAETGIPRDADCLAQAYVTKTIVGAAILEAAGFANLVAYLMTGQWPNLLAAACMLLGILVSLPRGFTISLWVQQQMRRIREQRSLGPGHRLD